MKLVIPFLIIALMQSCGLQSVDHNEDLENKITSVLLEADCKKAGSNPHLDFNTITDFEWDKLYVVGAYQSIGALYLNAKIDINQIKDPSIRYGKVSQHVLVFTLNNQIVSYVKYPRTGDFDNIVNMKKGYRPQEAIFSVCERGDSTYQGLPIYQILPDSLNVVDSTLDLNLL